MKKQSRVASSELRVGREFGVGSGSSQIPHPSSLRSGFTLVELLIVATIMLLLAAAAAPVAMTLLNGRSLREASSNVQAVIAGARDRASSARDARGVRLIPDSNNPSIVREIRYVRPAAPLSTGSAIVVDATWNAGWNSFIVPFPPDAPPNQNRPVNQPVMTGSSWPTGGAGAVPPQFSMVVLLGCTDAVKLRSLPYRIAADGNRVYFGVIRLATAGQPLGFSASEAMIANTVGSESCPLLRLDQPLTRPYPFDVLRPGQLPYSAGFPATYDRDYLASVGDNYTIPIGTVELEGETPIALPAGVVIDLGYINPTGASAPDPSGVRLSRLQPEYTNWDIMFAPTGSLIGSAAADAHLFLWLREEQASVQDVPVATTVAPSGQLRMIPTNNSGNHAIVAVVSRTGLVRSVEPNFGAMQGASATATMDADGTTTGPSFAYWNRLALYDLFFSELNAPDGGETGL
jgi:prepilin-type N-terminal cleavage/methylation domain-containing protein